MRFTHLFLWLKKSLAMVMLKNELGYCCTYPFASPNYDESIAIRHQILRQPLGLHFSIEQLEAEWNQFHLGYFSKTDRMLACLVLHAIDGDNIKMRQVAVLEKYQGHGLGRILVNCSEAFALMTGAKRIVLHARNNAVPFYLALGYNLYPEMFLEVGIPHYKMEKTLSKNPFS